jgi:protein-tyrosine phosphatase
MGFEVNHSKLMELGMHWAEYLHFDGSNEFLLELPSRGTEVEFAVYERTIFELQGMGYEVIVAHPERCRAIQKNPMLAQSLSRMGCKLQASADYIDGGRLGREKKPARRLFEEGLYDFIASDAHCVEHYGCLARAMRIDGASLHD